MGSIASAFTSIFRRYKTDGVSASGTQYPPKADLRGLGAIIETYIGAAIDTLSTTVTSALGGKADKATGATGTGIATVTGNLGTGLTIAVAKATVSEVLAGNDTKAATGAGVVAAIDRDFKAKWPNVLLVDDDDWYVEAVDRRMRVLSGTALASGRRALAPDGTLKPFRDSLAVAQPRLQQLITVDDPDWRIESVDRRMKVLRGKNATTGDTADDISGSGSDGYYALAPGEALPRDWQVDWSTFDWGVVLIRGQSLAAGQKPASGTYNPLSTSQPYSNLSFANGPRSALGTDTATTAALIENTNAPNNVGCGESISSGANFFSELCALEANVPPSERIIFVADSAVGGQAVTALVQGGTYYSFYRGQVSELVARAAEAGKRIAFLGVIVAQGEADRTLTGDWETIWQADQAREQSYLRGLSLQTFPVPYFFYQTATGSRDGATYQTAGRMQTKIERTLLTYPNFYGVGPVYQHPRGSNDQHLTNYGYLDFGRQAWRAVYHYAVQGIAPKRFRFLSATRLSNAPRVITVKCDCEGAALVFDAALCGGQTTNQGFAVYDAGGRMTITSGPTISGKTISMTVSADPSGTVKVRYARDDQPTGISTLFDEIATGNLRSDLAITYSFGGATRTIYEVAPHDELTVITLAA